MELRKGQKISLNDDKLIVTFERTASALDIDTSAFLLGANAKAASDDDFVFYGNTVHAPDASVMYIEDDGAIHIHLEKIPRSIERIAVTATIYDANVRKQNFGQLKNSYLKICNYNGVEVATFKLDTFTVETAIVLCEIYRYKGAWKLNATGSGFKGGLAALCQNFGIEVSDEITAPPKVEPPPKKVEPPKKIDTQRTKSSRKTSTSTSSTSSSSSRKKTSTPKDVSTPPKKIELKKGQKVNLIKKGDSPIGDIVINLNWEQPSQPRGFFDSLFGSKGIDLDLCCLYELKDGEIGAVQALGNLFGNLYFPPYIELDGDDRTGNNAAGETMRINGQHVKDIRRVLIYTFIYEGAANWEEARGVVTVTCPGSPQLIVRMDDYGSKLHTCAVALLENVGGALSVEKVVQFFRDSKEMDDAFDWGLNWTVGRKD
ncbi:MAG: TerD domain-containing protein [Selenomonadaceae bacterium]|nr:TerD domain-containing protein [Selenomonadaceae bacterium]